jgi:hypothetical protein
MIDNKSLLKYNALKVIQKKGINNHIFRILFSTFNLNKKAKVILKYLHNFLLKYAYTFLFNLLFLYLNHLGFKSYRLTLIGCNKTQQECLKMDLVKLYKDLIIYMVYSILIFGITFTLSLWRYISIFHIFYIIYKYILLYKEDHYSELSKHGQYNMVIFIFGVTLIIIIFNLYFLLRKIIKSKKYNLTIYVIIILISIVSLKSYTFLKNKSNCIKWGIGLNNTSINKYNYTSECSIIIPKNCPMNSFYGFMDLSKILKIDCKRNENFINSRNLLLKYLKSDNPSYDFSNTNKFGYPNSNIYSAFQFKNISHFNQKIISNILDYNNQDNLKYLNENNKSDIILEFSNNFKDAKINIDVNFKSNLSKIRKLKENSQSIYDNVLFIFFDSLSRAHFQRTMNKTCKLLEKYMKNNNLYSAYQFNKYHSLGTNTHPNVMPMYYGFPMNQERGQNVIRYFKENGYITANIGNICSKELFAIEKKQININYDIYDHENIGMWCDPNYYDRSNPYPINKGEYSVLRRCLYGKEVYEYLFEYAKDFWKKYKENRKFARLSFIEGHELTAEVIKYLDNPLYQFLNGFIEEGYLNNSSIIIASDHGLHYGIYVNTQSEDALIENFLPLLIFLLPNNRNNKIELEELYINQDKFITPFDIYNTMIFIAEGNKNSNHNSKYGNSLLDYINCKCLIKK